jgi:hypothetical protein
MLFLATNSLGKEMNRGMGFSSVRHWLSKVWEIMVTSLASALKVLVNRMDPESGLFCAMVEVCTWIEVKDMKPGFPCKY